MMSATYAGAASANIWQLAGQGIGAAPYQGQDFELQKQRILGQLQAVQPKLAAIPQPPEDPMSERRLVRVVMVDPNDDVPTEIALLYDSKEVFTDKTDQELYFDIPVADLLESHNDKRTKIVDKKVKERTEYLEPARIRDLKMLVITLAKF